MLPEEGHSRPTGSRLTIQLEARPDKEFNEISKAEVLATSFLMATAAQETPFQELLLLTGPDRGHLLSPSASDASRVPLFLPHKCRFLTLGITCFLPSLKLHLQTASNTWREARTSRKRCGWVGDSLWLVSNRAPAGTIPSVCPRTEPLSGETKDD